jgi:hypothetical protein
LATLKIGHKLPYTGDEPRETLPQKLPFPTDMLDIRKRALSDYQNSDRCKIGR